MYLGACAGVCIEGVRHVCACTCACMCGRIRKGAGWARGEGAWSRACCQEGRVGGAGWAAGWELPTAVRRRMLSRAATLAGGIRDGPSCGGQRGSLEESRGLGQDGRCGRSMGRSVGQGDRWEAGV